MMSNEVKKQQTRHSTNARSFGELSTSQLH